MKRLLIFIVMSFCLKAMAQENQIVGENNQKSKYSGEASSLMQFPMITKTVKVKKAGTLADLLTDEEKANISDLTIEGKLNSSDIVLLRKMAGAKDKRDDNTWTGRLRRLDLSNADFANDDTPYFSSPVGRNYRVKIGLKDNFLVRNTRTGETSMVSRDQYLSNRQERWEGNSKRILAKDPTRMRSNSVLDNGGEKVFEFNKLSDREWKEMLEYGWNKHTDHFESRADGDSVYYVNCHTAKHWISQAMFYKCLNLEVVVLNENTERISNNAFAGCKALKEIVIPRKVEQISTSAFKKTPSLCVVSISRNPDMVLMKANDATIIQRFFKDSSPELKIIRY